jgi:hypothetical protein
MLSAISISTNQNIHILGRHRVVISENWKDMKQHYIVSTSFLPVCIINLNWSLHKIVIKSTRNPLTVRSQAGSRPAQVWKPVSWKYLTAWLIYNDFGWSCCQNRFHFLLTMAQITLLLWTTISFFSSKNSGNNNTGKIRFYGNLELEAKRVGKWPQWVQKPSSWNFF